MIRWFLRLAVLSVTSLAGCHSAQNTRLAESQRAPQIHPSTANPPADSASPYASMKSPRASDGSLVPAGAVKKTDPDGPRWPDYTSPPPPAPLPKIKAELVSIPLDSDSVARSALPLANATPKHPLVLALECVLDGRHDEALKHLDRYDARTQEFLLRVLPTLSLVAKNKSLTPEDVAALNEQLASIRAYLQLNAEFAIAKVVFCESIQGYAVYKPLPENHEFVAARPDRPGEMIQLYVELRNFANKQNQGLFETRLASRIEILDGTGQSKWSHRFPADDLKLVSRTRLNEYYHNYTFALPPHLPPGSYTLTVEMTDETVAPARTSRAVVPFRVTAAKD